MEIRSRNLLNQAENILKDRNGDNKSIISSADSAKNSTPSAADSIFTRGIMESRMLSLQQDLTRIQSQFSKEQARMGYLEKDGSEVKSDKMYDGEPLFPELQENPETSRTSLLELVKGKMSNLTHNLKGSQVEMENLLALSFQDPKDFSIAPEDLSGVTGSMNQLNPDRVAQLTRNNA
jgi:hypothetical protein